MPRLNTEFVLSLALGFVVIWFGYQEITDPESWAGYVPSFLDTSSMVTQLVMVHGVVLVLSGLALVFNFHRTAAAAVIALMLLGIIGTLIMDGGLDEIAVRDIGLFGMALALATRN